LQKKAEKLSKRLFFVTKKIFETFNFVIHNRCVGGGGVAGKNPRFGPVQAFYQKTSATAIQRHMAKNLLIILTMDSKSLILFNGENLVLKNSAKKSSKASLSNSLRKALEAIDECYKME
jgi:hypothetical protein